MKKIIIGLVSAFIIVIIYKSFNPKFPEFNPERNYVDFEEQILEAFILAEDSVTI